MNVEEEPLGCLVTPHAVARPEWGQVMTASGRDPEAVCTARAARQCGIRWRASPLPNRQRAASLLEAEQETELGYSLGY